MVFGAIAGGLTSAVAGNVLSGGGSRADGGGGRAAEFRLDGNPFYDVLFNKTRGPDQIRVGASGALGQAQSSAAGLADYGYNAAVNNPSADLARQLGLEFLQGVDPGSAQEIMQQQYDLLNPILEEDREQARLQLENRLFAQGRLGSTGGANDMNALLDAQSADRRRLLAESLGLGLQSQQAQLGLASGFSQLDPSLRGLFAGVGSQGVAGATGIQDSATRLFSAMGGVEGGGVGGGGGGGYSPQQAIGAGLVNSGIGAISQGVGGLFQGGGNPGPYAGPYTPSGRPTRNGYMITPGQGR